MEMAKTIQDLGMEFNRDRNIEETQVEMKMK